MAYKPNTSPRYAGDLQVLNDQQLLEEARTFLTPGHNSLPRSIAAEILDRVADAGNYGDTVAGFDSFIIGVAVRRLVSNYPSSRNDPESDWKAGFIFGLNFNPNKDTIPVEPQMSVTVRFTHLTAHTNPCANLR